MKTVALLMVSVLLCAGCASMSFTKVEPPPIPKEKPQDIPTVALLPWYTSQPEVAAHAYQHLREVLQERYVFRFVSKSKVEASIKRNNINLGKIFGLKDQEFQKLAEDLDTDYVMGGAFTVVKDLSLFGWRKSIRSDLRLYSRDQKEKIKYWREAGAAFVAPNDMVDTQTMTESAMNHLANRIMKFLAL